MYRHADYRGDKCLVGARVEHHQERVEDGQRAPMGGDTLHGGLSLAEDERSPPRWTGTYRAPRAARRSTVEALHGNRARGPGGRGGDRH